MNRFLDVFREVPLFRAMKREERENILFPGISTLDAAAGTQLPYESERKSFLYVVSEGVVSCHTVTNDGRELIQCLFEKGSVIGLESLNSEVQGFQVLKAFTDCGIIRVNRSDLRFIVESNPDVALEVIKTLGKQLIESRKLNRKLSFFTMRQRVADSLLLINKKMDGELVNKPLSLSRNTLAMLSGSTRESATKLIKEFEKEKILSVNSRNIQIQSTEDLLKIVEKYQ